MCHPLIIVCSHFYFLSYYPVRFLMLLPVYIFLVRSLSCYLSFHPNSKNFAVSSSSTHLSWFIPISSFTLLQHHFALFSSSRFTSFIVLVSFLSGFLHGFLVLQKIILMLKVLKKPVVFFFKYFSNNTQHSFNWTFCADIR